MIVVTDPASITTPNATMTTHAAPSRGSTELAAWRVRMAPGASGPAHTVDREQVWLPLHGTITVTVAGVSTVVGPGQSVVFAAGEQRQVSTPDEAAEILVCMTAGALVHTPDGAEPRPLPWAS